MARISAVDQYILNAQPFAQPILIHIRELVHSTCPEAEEKIKWGMPFFDYKGDMLCHMAAFKKHAVMGFWKAPLIKDPILMANAQSESAMGHLGKLTSIKDLPSDKKIRGWIKEAMQLNEQGIKLPKAPAAKPAQPLKPHPSFTQALKADAIALEVWNAFSASHKKEYITWINEAKTEPTRNRRISESIRMISEGKGRNWKYAKK